MLLKSIARVLVRRIGNAVGFGVAGDAAVEIWDLWDKYNKEPQQKLAEVQHLAEQSANETRETAKKIAQEEAADQPETVRIAIASYLTQVPANVRRSLKRPADPTGRTVPPGLLILKSEDLLALLPTKPARFKPGDRPLSAVDWELDELLGMGGFGEVWKARNPYFDGVAPVALKFCLDSEAAKALRYEAAILNQVMRQGKHSGIVQLQHSYLSADPPCLEYEYVAGGDLTGLINDWHRSPGGCSVRSVTDVMGQLAAIVGFAHRLTPPVVHRDLKPANILIQRGLDGVFQYKIADFGIGGIAAGRAIQEAAEKPAWDVTALRTGTCTPLYASPQQQAGRSADPRDDVFSLGVIWYQMLTGNLSAGAPGGSAWKKRLIERGMEGALADLLESCFEDHPNDRPNDGAALADGLKSARAKLPSLIEEAAEEVEEDILDSGEGERDAWGSIIGSSNAKVNAVLIGSAKPMTVPEITAATGLRPKQVRYAHLTDLISRGLVVREGQTYRALGVAMIAPTPTEVSNLPPVLDLGMSYKPHIAKMAALAEKAAAGDKHALQQIKNTSIKSDATSLATKKFYAYKMAVLAALEGGDVAPTPQTDEDWLLEAEEIIANVETKPGFATMGPHLSEVSKLPAKPVITSAKYAAGYVKKADMMEKLAHKASAGDKAALEKLKSVISKPCPKSPIPDTIHNYKMAILAALEGGDIAPTPQSDEGEEGWLLEAEEIHESAESPKPIKPGFLVTWGPREGDGIGGEARKVMEELERGPLTAKVLAEKTGATEKRVLRHIGYWRLKGAAIIETESGYLLDEVANKSAGDKDRFGSRVGSNYAKANAVLTTTPKKMKQIVEEAGVPDSCYDHFNRLIAKGLVKKSDEGYYVDQ